jgi:hypothetical protein
VPLKIFHSPSTASSAYPSPLSSQPPSPLCSHFNPLGPPPSPAVIPILCPVSIAAAHLDWDPTSLPRVSSPSILSFTVLCAAAPTSLPATISATMLDLDPAVIHGIYTVVGELEAQSQSSTNVIEGTIRQFQCIVVIPGDMPMCCNGTIHAVLIPISTCCEFESRTGQ